MKFFISFAVMNKKDFSELLDSVKEAKRIMRGEAKPARIFKYTPIDVKRIREKKFRKSQTEFASMLGLSVNTIQDWEQGRRHPSGPARALLNVASRHPKLVADVLLKEAAA